MDVALQLASPELVGLGNFAAAIRDLIFGLADDRIAFSALIVFDSVMDLCSSSALARNRVFASKSASMMATRSKKQPLPAAESRSQILA